MNESCGTAQPEKKERYFEIGYLLRGQKQWKSGHTLSTDEQSAISNFLMDYSPSMGTIVGVHVFGDDGISSSVLEKLHAAV